MRWVRSALCLALSACLAGAALCGCNKSSQAAAGAAPAMVTTVPVLVQDVPEYIDEIGKTASTEMVTVTPQVSGKIIKRLFEDGADLNAGQELFEIDPRLFQASVDAANATLQQYQAQLANAQTDFDRDQSLMQSNPQAVSQQDFDAKKSALAIGKANVKAGEAALETAKLNLEYCKINSPLDGRAGARLVDAGNVVTANLTQLLVVQKIAPIYVDFTIAENDLDRVRQEMARGSLRVTVNTPDEPSAAADGTLTFLDNSVQDGTGTIKLRATVENKDRHFWPGQFVQVRLILTTLKDALLIPSESVQIGQQGQYVYVVTSDPTTKVTTVRQQLLTLGQKQGDLVVVVNGLKPEDVIMHSGQEMMMVMPGAPITVVPSAPPGGGGAGAHP